MVTIDDELAERTGLKAGTEWLAVRGFRQADGAPTPICGPSTTSTARSPRSAGCCNGTPGRSSRSSRTCSGSASSRCTRRSPRSRCHPSSPAGLKVEAGTAALEMHRTYKTSDGEIAQVTINTHPSSRFRHSMTMRRVKG